MTLHDSPGNGPNDVVRGTPTESYARRFERSYGSESGRSSVFFLSAYRRYPSMFVNKEEQNRWGLFVDLNFVALGCLQHGKAMSPCLLVVVKRGL